MKTFATLTLASMLTLTGVYGAAGLVAAVCILGTVAAAVLVGEAFSNLLDRLAEEDELA